MRLTLLALLVVSIVLCREVVTWHREWKRTLPMDPPHTELRRQ